MNNHKANIQICDVPGDGSIAAFKDIKIHEIRGKSKFCRQWLMKVPT